MKTIATAFALQTAAQPVQLSLVAPEPLAAQALAVGGNDAVGWQLGFDHARHGLLLPAASSLSSAMAPAMPISARTVRAVTIVGAGALPTTTLYASAMAYAPSEVAGYVDNTGSVTMSSCSRRSCSGVMTA